jgi:hypothetical protein
MATRTAAPGLSTDELARIRDTLAAGRKPKVVFTAAAGQIAGQVGQVIELTDPELSDEWVVVRFGHDELPFSPADLQLPARAKPTVRAAALPAPLPGPREESSVPSSPTAPLNGAARPAKAAKAAAAAAAESAKAEPAKAEPVKAAPPVKAAADKPAEKATTKAAEPAAANAPAAAPPAAAAPAAPPAKAPARKAGKPKPPPSLTVTLTYAEGEWMVGATQGSKALAKPYVIKPAEALKMVSMLDVPGVHDAVDDIVSAARAEAEQQAERLRAELAEVESRLAELRDAG